MYVFVYLSVVDVYYYFICCARVGRNVHNYYVHYDQRDIGDLRSGQFCDLSIISQWEKNERRLF